MSKKLIIWDFDGVIADTEKLWLRNRMEMINDKLGLNWDFKTVVTFLAGAGDKTRQEILQKMGIITDQTFWDEALTRDLQDFIKGFTLTEGVEDIFKMSRFDQCIATGGSSKKTALKIKQVDIEKYFPPEKVFTVDLVSYGKPEPDLFLLAAEVMGYSPQDCIVIEDSLIGMTAGVRAKMKVIAYLGSGIYDDTQIETELRNLGVAEVFYTMADVRTYLDKI